MQIWVCATTATTCPNGAAIVTANSHPLPSWAPDIAYIPTTTLTAENALAMANVYGPTTTNGVAILQRCVIRGYSARRFGVPMRIGSLLTMGGATGAAAVSHAAKGDVVIALTYRAVGELKR